jgi:hypothetical protein
MMALRTLGINLLGARNSALQNLVAEIPPPVVAHLLGYSHNSHSDMHIWRPNHGRATSRSGCAAPTRLTELSATDRCRATTDPEYDEFKYADLPVARMRCPPPRRAGGLPVLRFHPMNQAVLPSVSGRELNRRRKPTGSAKPLSATVSWRFGTAYGAHRPGACRSPSMRLCSSSPNGRQKHSTQTVPTSAPVRRRGANRPPRRVRPRTVADAACQPNGKDSGTTRTADCRAVQSRNRSAEMVTLRNQKLRR